MKLDECRKIVRKLDFFAAIEVGDEPSAAEGLDLSTISVEDDYDGVRLGEEMTQEFIDDMTERFKNGKKIHRKYVYQIILAVKKLVYDEPTMVEMKIPEGTQLTVCGDTHGMFLCISFGSKILTRSQGNTLISWSFSVSTERPTTSTSTSLMVTLSTVDHGLAKSLFCSTHTSGSDLTLSS